MINKICDNLIKKMKKDIPEITEEKEETIRYGLELMIGELPKIILLFGIAFLLKIGWLVLFAYITMLPYKITAGGFHLKTNIGCFLCTTTTYYGNVFLSQYINISTNIKYLLILILWFISIIMIYLYAPADTENMPILRKKERKVKKILSYIIVTIILVISIIINDNTLSNILLINVIIETFSITRIAYRITNNKYGFEVYQN